MVTDSQRRALDPMSLAQDLMVGDLRGTAALFEQAGGCSPLVIWSPDIKAVNQQRLLRFSARCDQLGAPNATLSDRYANAECFGPLADWMMILRYDEKDRLVYDHYGAGIARVYGKDMTDASPEAFPGHIGSFFIAVYHVAKMRRSRVLTIHQPPKQVFVTTWQRLIVPTDAADGTITGFVVLNLPEHALSAGLEVVPLAILIVDQDGSVCFANRVGRECFDRARFGPWGRSLFEYAGLDLQFKTPPGDLLVRGLIEHHTVRQISHNQIKPYHAIVSATLHHDAAFFVVTLQPKVE